jgi:hypothetical protein
MTSNKVIDNFLPKEKFEVIKKLFLGDTFPWYYSPTCGLPDSNDGFYFFHEIYRTHLLSSKEVWNAITPLLNKINEIDFCRSIVRVRSNCYVKTHKLVEFTKHRDYPFETKGFLYYVNSNDGFTKLEDGSIIESVENRALFFDTHKLHNASTCTNTDLRINININYV